ncbi:nucleotidyltransferase domain-containing protein [Alicyclobacillus tolerans]|uniref:Nucleotidyltransferase domain-containing protein n=1 Tax=Alicyclobacillus tolerans TaxID=90970 RepID=A0A1M6UUY8_9BACL|nr:nucleotidyltransferase domain-containing protein [Alicyclobacillus montanus]SHK73004.1 Nucleotidyltransferase domain-containing protein [Alicyclobacillus montanus]
MNLDAFEAANHFVEFRFPSCQAALLAGSVVRGEATNTSDLDIVVFDDSLSSAYRESLFEYGWAIEVFVHSLQSYRDFFDSDCKRARPSLPRMVSEGVVLKDSGIIDAIKSEAKKILENGPDRWSLETIAMKRYMLSDALDDFIGSSKEDEDLFIANTLADAIHEFFLRTHGQWIGASKWIVRALKQYDEVFANEFINAFTTFYQTGNKIKIVKLTDKVLEPFGGRLFHGFSIGKN